mmetsp:Transcript_25464/g.64122  ORF Transcript_25464/g.64122 Transcript_25464/m.64122 type:complete len:242 (+) Transcript_25464:551-1276(+)
MLSARRNAQRAGIARRSDSGRPSLHRSLGRFRRARSLPGLRTSAPGPARPASARAAAARLASGASRRTRPGLCAGPRAPQGSTSTTLTPLPGAARRSARGRRAPWTQPPWSPGSGAPTCPTGWQRLAARRSARIARPLDAAGMLGSSASRRMSSGQHVGRVACQGPSPVTRATGPARRWAPGLCGLGGSPRCTAWRSCSPSTTSLASSRRRPRRGLASSAATSTPSSAPRSSTSQTARLAQ